MIRAVLDANTIASGMARFRTGTTAPAAILRAWVTGEFELLLSEHILDEVLRTLAKPYFLARVGHDVFEEMLDAFLSRATPVQVTQSVSGVASHPEDDLVLAAVASAGADYLVTGDRQLQRLDAFWGGRIVSPAEFRAILDGASG